MYAVAGPEDHFDRVPLTKRLLGLETRRDAVRRGGGDATRSFFVNDVLLAGAFFLVGNLRFHLRGNPLALHVNDRAVHTPPLADAAFHDVVLDRGQPARARVGLPDTTVKNAAVAADGRAGR